MVGSITYDEIAAFVENNISIFHDKQLEDLKRLSLVAVLGRKNPYLFRAKNLNVAGDLVKYVLDAFLISQEETNFGEFLERLAIFINSKVYGGWKSTNTGMDLEFVRDGVYYIVSIKSGPNWGNSDQQNRMYLNFEHLIKALTEKTPGLLVIPVNGCCYGKDQKPKKYAKIKINKEVVSAVVFYKLCGQRFWEFISGNPALYIDIVEPLGHQAKEKNELFLEEYAKIINLFTLQFGKEFCDPTTGAIRWEEIVKLSSAASGSGSQDLS
ncbi:MAG: cytosolic protein [Chloroflexi bacterium]|uniref:Cytosolic protein n=1 Tax=Candidatus Chlorohelix allophototropha TaxID=3003348 RepID=A0A8T7LVS9_9CHLR|nr:cytosolic protein [Chloroflexota bacterium]WJW65497.1 cytosolic protein [Chloroflexota bacterium L227-S17]